MSGLDWGLTNAKGTFSPDAIYVLRTDDNATFAVFEKGYAPNVHILFETGSTKYAWLNTAVAYATGGPIEGGVALDVWQVSFQTRTTSRRIQGNANAFRSWGSKRGKVMG